MTIQHGPLRDTATQFQSQNVRAGIDGPGFGDTDVPVRVLNGDDRDLNRCYERHRDTDARRYEAPEDDAAFADLGSAVAPPRRQASAFPTDQTKPRLDRQHNSIVYTATSVPYGIIRHPAHSGGSPPGEASAKTPSVLLTLDAEPSAAAARGPR